MNLGILHRDVSDGNVMLLRSEQIYTRRNWTCESSGELKSINKRFGIMSESETALRKVIEELDRDPKGMLSDFDLHTKHSTAPGGFVSPHCGTNSGSESGNFTPESESVASSKRRKTGARSSVSVRVSNDGKDTQGSSVSLEDDSHKPSKTGKDRQLIDFRTVSDHI